MLGWDRGKSTFRYLCLYRRTVSTGMKNKTRGTLTGLAKLIKIQPAITFRIWLFHICLAGILKIGNDKLKVVSGLFILRPGLIVTFSLANRYVSTLTKISLKKANNGCAKRGIIFNNKNGKIHNRATNTMNDGGYYGK